MAPWFWYAVVAAVLIRCASNIHPARIRSHRRRPRRFRGRGYSCAHDSSLSCGALAHLPLESEIQLGGLRLFGPDGRLRWRGHDRIFSPLPKRRAALVGAGDSCGWRGHHGHCRHFVFQRAGVGSEDRRNYSGAGRAVSSALVTLFSPPIERDVGPSVLHTSLHVKRRHFSIVVASELYQVNSGDDTRTKRARGDSS